MEPLKIHALTWNVNARDAPNNLDCSTVLGGQDNYAEQTIDIFAIGFQEVTARIDKYLVDNLVNGDDSFSSSVRSLLQDHDYVKIRTIRLLGTLLNVFCLRRHLPHLRNIETQYTRLSLGGYWGFKGAVSVRFELYGVSYCFVNSHLTAHDHLLETRIQEYNTIIETHKYKNRDANNILYHDYIVWMGDLNFRLVEGSFEFSQISDAIQQNQFKKLLEVDQLSKVRREEKAFHELTDILPSFPPTYKFAIGSQQYDSKRRPAWTDRILHRVNVHNYEDLGPDVQLCLEAYNYVSHPGYTCSDHKPVSVTLKTLTFSEKLAEKKKIPAFNPIINFLALTCPWYINEDGKFSYAVVQNGGQYLDSWDWIGLYHENFTSLEDYVTFCWASSCRRTGFPKNCVIADSALYLTGKYVLVYTSSRQSILGISEAFEVTYRPPLTSESEIELAEEAAE